MEWIMDKINKKLGMSVHVSSGEKNSVPFLAFGKMKKIKLKNNKIEELGNEIAKFLKFELLKEEEKMI